MNSVKNGNKDKAPKSCQRLQPKVSVKWMMAGLYSVESSGHRKIIYRKHHLLHQSSSNLYKNNMAASFNF
jgi:hypothetical protein